jgi:hypothetical protein
MVLDAGDLSDIAGILEDAKLLPDGYSGLTAKVIERP